MLHSLTDTPGDPAGLALADLVVALVVLAAIIGALGRGSGVLGAVGAGLGTALASWLVLVAVSTWAPPPLARAADRSSILHTVPVPDRALHEAGRLVLGLGAGPAPDAASDPIPPVRP